MFTNIKMDVKKNLHIHQLHQFFKFVVNAEVAFNEAGA